MANLSLSHIYKVYPNGTKAVSDFTMNIDDKEFIVFVGPSGCGKSTTLRMIAGLEEISSGELKIGDNIVNNVEPKARDIAMVFQNYALYPHMSVYENMAFGLRIKKTPKDEIDQRVREAAEILGITEYLQRKPKEMSGGQRQRVALGRALVRKPKVFLLDEPLSNLDAKLRTSMRSEISKLHKKLGTTFIYVTHDQVEAMTMGTRIVVMKLGYIQQIDTPRNLYNYPVNKFVAGFIGTPQMNFFDGTLKLEGGKVKIKFDNTDVEFEAPYDYFAKADKTYLNGEKKVSMGLRAEHISSDENKYPFKAKCKVSNAEDLGIDTQIYADFNINDELDSIKTSSKTKVVIKAPAGSFWSEGDVITVSLDLEHLHLFDAETEQSISPRIPLKAVTNATVKGNKIKMLGTAFDMSPAIDLTDGEYEVTIPKAAMTVGKTVKVTYVEEEDVNGERLLKLACGNEILFITALEGENVSAIDIDLKYCTFMRNGTAEQSALNMENKLSGKLSYTRSLAQNDARKIKIPKKYDYKYYYDIAGKVFDCSQDLAKFVVAGLGSKGFNEPLVYVFDPYSIKVADDGIEAKVNRVLDYGTEKFAICEIDLNAEKRAKAKSDAELPPEIVTVTVSVADDFESEAVRLTFDTDKASIYGVTHDIRLV